MPELSDLLDDLAATPAPPRSLSADELFATGRRQRRRRQAAGVAGTAVGLALVLVAAIAWWPAGRHHRPAPVPATSTGNAVDVAWTQVVDPLHAFAAVPLCPPAPEHCAKSTNTVYGTDDGGRTWTERSVVGGSADLTAVDRDVLIAGSSTTDGVYPPVRLSTDGGRTWSELADGSPPVPSVPAGGALLCRSPDYHQACKLSAVDPRSRRIAPLAGQPDLILGAYNLIDPDGQIQLSGDRILVAGADDRTGRPAVAASDDRGRTWSTHVFTDLPCAHSGDCGREVSVRSTPDGTTRYAVADDVDRHHLDVYRQVGSAGWARWGTEITYAQQESLYHSFVTADGTYILGLSRVPPRVQSQPDLPPQVRYLTLRDGTYQEAELDGLPATAVPPARIGAGPYFAPDYITNVLYTSADGVHWTQFPLVR